MHENVVVDVRERRTAGASVEAALTSFVQVALMLDVCQDETKSGLSLAVFD